ncbi:AraC family transcriptional regulator [Pleionea sediminis]|uniref:AraC family transcriptional regulator n=1 Tax=Pleionea sediminis TaxID=2569479 RepID=UPI0011860D56|nr:AraC family transcriptional regulator [Pleionea sediminis]
MTTELTKDASNTAKNRTVAVSYARALINHCAKIYDFTATQLISHAGLLPDNLQDDKKRISAAQYNNLICSAAELSDDPLLGWRFGTKTSTASFNLLGYITMSAETLGDAAKALQNFELLVSDIGHTVIEKSYSLAHAKWIPHSSCEHFSFHIPEAVFAGWINFGRTIVGWDVPINQITFSHRKAKSLQKSYSDFFNCPVIFNQTENAIEFDTKWLSLPLAQAQRKVFNALINEAENSVNEINSLSMSFEKRVKHLIRANLYQSNVSMEHIAQQLKISKRTLQRYLSNDGLTYRELIDNCKQELAIELIKSNQLPLITIAGILGFSEQSSFTRAFKRWTNQSPQLFRSCNQKKQHK